MSPSMIKNKIDENNKMISELLNPTEFTLNNAIKVLMDENNMLQSMCEHNFVDGRCEYCYKEEK
jgi:hypothetical protein